MILAIIKITALVLQNFVVPFKNVNQIVIKSQKLFTFEDFYVMSCITVEQSFYALNVK